MLMRPPTHRFPPSLPPPRNTGTIFVKVRATANTYTGMTSSSCGNFAGQILIQDSAQIYGWSNPTVREGERECVCVCMGVCVCVYG